MQSLDKEANCQVTIKKKFLRFSSARISFFILFTYNQVIKQIDNSIFIIGQNNHICSFFQFRNSILQGNTCPSIVNHCYIVMTISKRCLLVLKLYEVHLDYQCLVQLIQNKKIMKKRNTKNFWKITLRCHCGSSKSECKST